MTRVERAAGRAVPFVPSPPHAEDAAPGSVASIAWHRLVLIGIVLVLILVILPAVLGAAGTQVLALA